MVNPTKTTKGSNVNYGKQESDSIIDEVYYFLKDNKRLSSLLKSISTESRRLELATSEKIAKKEGGKKLEKHEQIIHDIKNKHEIEMDGIILSNPDLYQSIQRIYRNHGVDIPSQKTIDKGEVIDAKKKLIEEVMNLKQ